MCPPVLPCKGASIVHSPRTMRVFWYGNADTRTFGWAHRRRPYAMMKLRINRIARMMSVMLSRLYCAVQSFKMT